MKTVFRMLGIVLLVVMLALSGPSRAETNECTEAQTVLSPCKGLLVPAKDAEQCLQCKLDLDAEREWGKQLEALWQADIDELDNLLGIERRRSDALIKLLDTKLDPPAFYETVWFGAIIGVVGGIALTLTIVEVSK